jgi:hypothetical protein
MLDGHVLDPRLHSVWGEGTVAIMGRAEKVFRLGVLRVRVVAQAGCVREALLAVGTVVVLVTIVFLKFFVAVK